MAKFTVSPEACEDLDQIHAYISEGNPEAADRVLAAALSTFATLAKMPGMGRSRIFKHSELSGLRSFRAAGFILFKIDPSRGTEVLLRILGQDFQGILGCDDFAAYRKYARQCSVLVQFCLAHLIRDVKYLCEFPDAQVQRSGR